MNPFSVINNFHRISSDGLLAAYDMVSITGSVLTDISGNGKDGTLHGTTPGPIGVDFDGVDDYISLPAVLDNSDFTVIAIAKGPQANAGYIWSETNSADSSAGRTVLAVSHRPYVSLIRDADLNGHAIEWTPEQNQDQFHAFYIRRSGADGDGGVVDSEVVGAADLGGSIAVSTDLATLGARDKGATRDLWWEGTLAYVLVYNRALPDSELTFAYEQIRQIVERRGIFLARVLSPLRPGPIWERQGAVLSGSLANELPVGCQEPTVIYDTDPQIVSGSACFKMWYTGGNAGGDGGVFYAESLTGLPDTWEKHPSSLPVVGGLSNNYVLKVDGVYYLYGRNGDAGIDLYTSPDGVNFTLLQAAVITKGASGSWDETNIYNLTVIREAPTLWRMIYEALGGNYQGGTATSPDGINWTKNPLNPISFNVENGFSGPYVQRINGVYWAFAHNLHGAGPYSEIVRFRADDFNGPWQLYPRTFCFNRSGADEAAQVADRMLVEFNGQTYMFYAAGETTNGPFVIKLAIADMPISEVIKTSEGDVPLPPSPPTAYWNMDEASGARVDSAGANDLTDNNTVTSSAGKVGNAAQFTAANSESLSCADNADLSMAGTSFTISLWVYLDSDVNMQFVGRDDHGSGDREYAVVRLGGLAKFYIFGGGTNTFVGATALGTGAWHHIFAWRDTAGTINIQVDGGTVESASDAGISISDTTAVFAIGARNLGGTPDLFTDGRIDEVRIDRRVLSEQERIDIYNGGAGSTYP